MRSGGWPGCSGRRTRTCDPCGDEGERPAGDAGRLTQPDRLFREVTITSGGGNGAADPAAALALVRAQVPPYLPAHAGLIRSASGQTALSIEFAAPSLLGLLTAVIG